MPDSPHVHFPLLASLALGTACFEEPPESLADGTTSSAGTRGTASGADAGTASAGGTGMTADDPGSSTGEPTCVEMLQTECAPQVADAPTPLFEDRLLIRPPRSDADFVEPFQGTAWLQPVPIDVETCVEDCPAQIRFGSVGVLVDDNAPIASVAQMILADHGYPSPATLSEEDESFGEYWAVVDVDDVLDPPTKTQLYVSRRGDDLIWVLYRCPDEHWSALRPSFLASMESMILIPR